MAEPNNETIRISIGRVAGQGIPELGLPNEILVKKSEENYDTKWLNVNPILEDIAEAKFNEIVGDISEVLDKINGREV